MGIENVVKVIKEIHPEKLILIVLNCSCLAMVVEKKIDKIIGIEKGRNLLYNRLCN